MKKLLLPFSLLCSAFLAGCAAQPIALPSASAAGLKGKPLTPVTYPKPPTFGNMTPMKAGLAGLGGALGGLALALDQSGKGVIAGAQVDDPAWAIADGLAAKSSEKLGASVAPAVRTSGKGAPEQLAKEAQNTGLILDVATTNWTLIYFPSSWSRYRILYNARARLVDAESGKVIAQAPCNFVSDEVPDNAPTYDEMTSNGAAAIKELLNRAVAFCTDSMQSQMLGSL